MSITQINLESEISAILTMAENNLPTGNFPVVNNLGEFSVSQIPPEMRLWMWTDMRGATSQRSLECQLAESNFRIHARSNDSSDNRQLSGEWKFDYLIPMLFQLTDEGIYADPQPILIGFRESGEEIYADPQPTLIGFRESDGGARIHLRIDVQVSAPAANVPGSPPPAWMPVSNRESYLRLARATLRNNKSVSPPGSFGQDVLSREDALRCARQLGELARFMPPTIRTRTEGRNGPPGRRVPRDWSALNQRQSVPVRGEQVRADIADALARVDASLITEPELQTPHTTSNSYAERYLKWHDEASAAMRLPDGRLRGAGREWAALDPAERARRIRDAASPNFSWLA